MKFIVSTRAPYSVGQKIAIFTDHPEPVGSEVHITDTNNTLLNVARVTHVGLSQDINVNNGRKYVVNAQVEQEVSVQDTDPLVTRVYWN